MKATTRSPRLRRRRLVVQLPRPEVSLRFDRRGLLTLALVSLLALVAMAITLVVGRIPIHFDQVVAALLGHGSGTSNLVITTLRLPRVLVAVFVGAALGMSGAIFQSVTQNPLVAPDIIGVTSGASVAVVTMIVVGHGGQPPALVSFAGALLAAAAVYLLSVRSGLSRLRLVLIGIGVNAALGALIIYLLTTASLNQVLQANRYLLGDVSGATWPTVQGLLPAAAVLMALGTGLGAGMQVLQLGDDVATGVGAPVARSRLLLIVVGVGLAGVAVAAAGPVGFVAFIAPHIARGLARSTGAVVLPLSAAVGGALVVIADYAAQRLLEPTQLPVGILTVVIGGPYFMYLLLRASRAGLVG
ncbi:FecCD family ABC transporter permease [Pseudonocardia sp. GCM10023141]|uniref:FecCD family ABC transporter permease n=1 Tax=Pseudonocardia sp. GCM10023141 TaxID=3252653 RepID=UPI00360D9FFC